MFLSYSSKCLPTDRKRLSIQSGFSPPGLLCTSCSLPIIAHSAALTQKALYFCCCCLVTNNKELCTTLCDPMDWGWPSSPIHEILQARILEWVATPFTRESSRPRDWTALAVDSLLLSHQGSLKNSLYLTVYTRSPIGFCKAQTSYYHFP